MITISNFLNKDRYLVLPFWGLLYFVSLIQLISQTQSILQAILFPLFVLVSFYPLITYLSGPLLHEAMRSKSIRPFIVQFICFSVIIGIILGCWGYLFLFLEKKGVFPPSEYFKMTTDNSYPIVFLSSGFVTNLCICGVQFCIETIRLKKNLTEYELHNLRDRISPHFMFNVLNHIHVLMQSNVELASDLLIRYADILRYQLYNDENVRVTLDQDLGFVKDFISVEELRWQDQLKVSSSWIVNNPDKKIPSFLFIGLVENAFKHVSVQNEKKGWITIRFKETEKQITFRVENSISQSNLNPIISTNLGLENLKNRLNLLFYDQHLLSFEQTDSSFKAELTLNF